MSLTSSTTPNYRGAVNAGTTFFLDGTVNLFILAGILIGFGFPNDIVFGRIVPGAAMAVFIGNALMAWDTRRREKQTGTTGLTAIPIGLDILTTFLMAFIILGPIFTANQADMGTAGAATYAWKIGMAVTLWIGVGKLVLSLIGPAVQRILPNSAILGTLAGVAITWMGAQPFLEIFAHPEVGLFALAIVIFSLMAGHRLPFDLPGAFIAVFFGTVAYLVIAKLGLSPAYIIDGRPPSGMTIPHFSLGGITESFGGGKNYFGIVLPLTLFSAISAVNIVRSAKIVGDDFDTKRVMIIDAVATIVSALSGGVVQTVTYLGHTTYKRMGAKSSYGLGAGSIVLALAVFGIFEFAVSYIPKAVLVGVLIVVAADIIRISLGAVKSKTAPSFLFAIIPAVLAYVFSKVEQLYLGAEGAITALGGNINETLRPDLVEGYFLLGVLTRGSIMTSLLLASIVFWIIIKKFNKAAITAMLCAAFTACGLMHSVLSTSAIYPPWDLPDLGGQETIVWRFVIAYLVAGITLFALGLMQSGDTNMSDISISDEDVE